MEEIMPIIINALFGILIVLVGLAVTKLRDYLDEKGITEQIAQYSFLAELAVKAAEKIYGPGLGERKKEQAVTFFKEALNSYGVTLSEEEIEMFIEAAVEQMQESWKGNSIEEDVDKVE